MTTPGGSGNKNIPSIPYDNSVSGLTAENMQDAIDEVAASGGGGGGNDNTHSIELDGSTQYLDYSFGGPAPFSSGLTVEAWIYADNVSGTKTILGKNDPTLNDRSYLFYLEDNKLRLAVSDDGTSDDDHFVEYESVDTIEAQTWTHVAFTYNIGSDSCNFYINGSLGTAPTKIDGTTLTNTWLFSSSANFVLGAALDNSVIVNYFDGKIDEVRIWDTERNGTDISDNYNTHIDATFESFLISNWRFNNDSNDEKFSYNLTQQGSPVFSTDVGFVVTPTVGDMLKSVYDSSNLEGQIVTETDSQYLSNKIFSDNVKLQQNFSDPVQSSGNGILFTRDDKTLRFMDSDGYSYTVNLTPVSTNTHALDLEASSSQYVSIADGSQTNLDLSGNFTIEFWFKPEVANITQHLVGKWDRGDNNRSYEVRLETDGKVLLQVSTDGTGGSGQYKSWKTTTALSAGNHYHIAVTLNLASEECKFYINGESDPAVLTSGTGLDATIFNGTAPFSIGAGYNSGTPEFFADGIIDDVRVFSEERSATQIANNYQREINTTLEFNLVGYWKLNNNFSDSTINGNDLTDSGAPVFVQDLGF